MLWSSSDPLNVPLLMVNTKSAVKYQVKRKDDTTDAVINGYALNAVYSVTER